MDRNPHHFLPLAKAVDRTIIPFLDRVCIMTVMSSKQHVHRCSLVDIARKDDHECIRTSEETAGRP